MINHAYTLLRNRRGAGVDAAPGGVYIPPTYAPVSLPAGVERARRILFGTNPDPVYLNYRLWQYAELLHAGAYAGYLYGLDPRVTYWPRPEASPFEFGGGSVVVSGDAPLAVQGSVTADDAAGRCVFHWDVAVRPMVGAAGHESHLMGSGPSGDAGGPAGTVRRPLSAHNRIVQRNIGEAPPVVVVAPARKRPVLSKNARIASRSVAPPAPPPTAPARQGAVLSHGSRVASFRVAPAGGAPVPVVTAPGRLGLLLGRTSPIGSRRAQPPGSPVPVVTAPGRRGRLLGRTMPLTAWQATPAEAPPVPVVTAPGRVGALLSRTSLLASKRAKTTSGPPQPVGPYLVEITSFYGLDPAFPVVTAVATFTDGLSNAIPLPGSHLAVRLTANARPGDVGHVDFLARPVKDLTVIAAELKADSRNFALDLFGALPAEPFATFANLWFEHDQLPEQMTGLLLALIHRTEAFRNP